MPDDKIQTIKARIKEVLARKRSKVKLIARLVNKLYFLVDDMQHFRLYEASVVIVVSIWANSSFYSTFWVSWIICLGLNL